MTGTSLRLPITILTIVAVALVACGGSVSSSSTGLSGPPAPEYAFTGVAPGYSGIVEISNASRAGHVTILYFSFDG